MSHRLSSSHLENIPRHLTPQRDRETNPLTQETVMQLFEIAPRILVCTPNFQVSPK